MTSAQNMISLLLIGTLTQASAVAAETSVHWDDTVSVSAVQGNINYLLCLSGNPIDVKNSSLNKILFTTNKNEDVKIIQSFGGEKQSRVINGKSSSYLHVQFPDRDPATNDGWVPEEVVRLQSQCEGQDRVMAQAVAAAPTGGSTWTFPTNSRPTVSYKTGMRRFGASRDGGARLHAAADLYRSNGEPAIAVSAGTVIRDRYYFYLGTYAIEVKHTGGKVVRYGEITGKAAAGVKLGSALQQGQTLGYVGTVNSGCCSPMLHFEMFAGTATGALTQNGNKYQRRSDLIDPSSYLAVWEKDKFGQSY